MRLVMFMGLVSSILALTGCGDSKSADANWEGDRQTENPPPRPPDCPALPELKNVTLNDGRISDVRIIQVDDVKFYVPRGWLNDDMDRAFNSPFADRHTGPHGKYSPDVRDDECPGVVHRWVSKRSIFDLSFSFVVRRSNAEPWILPNFSLNTKIDKLSIRRPRAVTNSVLLTPETFEEGIIDWPTSTSPSARVMVVPNHLSAVYRWQRDKPMGSPEWSVARASVLDLIAWLRTPPRERDNDRIFKLGVEE